MNVDQWTTHVYLSFLYTEVLARTADKNEVVGDLPTTFDEVWAK